MAQITPQPATEEEGAEEAGGELEKRRHRRREQTQPRQPRQLRSLASRRSIEDLQPANSPVTEEDCFFTRTEMFCMERGQLSGMVS